MGPEHEEIRLPPVLIASDGRHCVHSPPGFEAAVLVRDTDLSALVHRVASDCPPTAIDIDTVAGLGADDAAVDFVTGRLGIRIILTRRATMATRVAERGGLGLVHIYGYDSTGMARSLESHPRLERVGSVLSPGLVIAHLRTDELAQLPRPLLAYGLIDEIEAADACLALADAIVVRPVIAARMAAAVAV